MKELLLKQNERILVLQMLVEALVDELIETKKVKEEKELDEAKFDALKHVKNPSPAVKAAAKDVKRGSYADRAALMKAGGVKDDRGPRGVTQEEAELHGRIQKFMADGTVQIDDPSYQRIMLCGSIAFNNDLRDHFNSLGFAEGNKKTQGTFVQERAFLPQLVLGSER